ncbi:hypothetical protein [Actinoplanes sp. NBRC 101535]|uniref:hypothetical protein n=1 Tax=Actinoplanes sp. NBRC 101535 TaxID=3032196 RepID=UPI0024A2ABD9|nr:hypothetical protein [Actinoplanes sp. NBRC 101535]GLY05292.1 hypothetical protein Acsp01_56710 [Actinoplanes sp. NBRC 101535]
MPRNSSTASTRPPTSRPTCSTARSSWDSTTTKPVLAYLGAQQRGFGGYYAESPTFNAALKAHYLSLLDGLQRLFVLRLDGGAGDRPNPVLLMLFRSTADSLLTLRTPWSNFLEAGLIHRKIDEAGEQGLQVNRATERINAAVADAREGHLEMLDALIAAMLGDRADLVVTESDIRTAGIDIIAEPSPMDHPLFDEE